MPPARRRTAKMTPNERIPAAEDTVKGELVAAREEEPSTEPPTIHQLLTIIKSEVGAIGKEQTNKDQHFNFRGIDMILERFHPVQVRHGLTIYPVTRTVDYHERENKSGTRMMFARVLVEWVFTGPAGDSISVVCPGEAFDAADKATTKAMSVSLRTAIIDTFQIPVNDPDPDLYTGPTQREEAVQQGGGDPVLAEWQDRIEAEWRRCWSWDLATVAKYYDDTVGGDLSTAGVRQLTAFFDHVHDAAERALAASQTEEGAK